MSDFKRIVHGALTLALGSAAPLGCGDDTATNDEAGSESGATTGATSSNPATTTGNPDTTASPDTTAGPSTSGADTSATTAADTTAGDTAGTSSGSTAGDSSGSSSGGTTGDTDTTTGGVVDPADYVDCGNAIPDAPDGEVCGVTPGSGAVLISGQVLAGSHIYDSGSVLVDGLGPNARILCAGCDCAGDPAAVGATRVDCPSGVISPGLINPHDHITFTLSQPAGHDPERYDHRHEWRLGQFGHTELDTFPGSDSSASGVLYGELRMLLGGATSIAGSGSEAGLLRNLDTAADNGGLAGVDANFRTFPLGDSGGEVVVAGCGYPNIDPTSNLQDDVYLPHIAEGVNVRARNEFLCMSGAPGGEDLVVGNTSIIHGIGLLTDDVDYIAQAGAKLVWSPRSNVSLYGITADVTTYRHLGVPIALGTDWTASGSMNVLRELKCVDQLNQNHYGGAFYDIDLWLMSTYWSALALGADDQLGLLRPGYIADIAVFDGSVDTRHRAVINAEVDDVALVLRGGEPLYGDAQVIEGLVDGSTLTGCEQLDVCSQGKRVCLQHDTGLTIAQIQAAVSASAYEFFFCGDPTDEPTCDPSRPMEFPAADDVTDGDGDGIADDDDNCPTVFNPVRPLDSAVQADADGDGLGDSCDVCPLADGESCTLPDPYDRDGDGVLDFDDNCAQDDNADQADGDDDGTGDACDACPEVANMPGMPCPVSIYDIKEGNVPANTAVVVEDVLVTAAATGNGFFVQVHPDDADYVGPEFSAVYVYTGAGGFTPTPGDRVTVGGTVQDFFGQTQLVQSQDAVVESSGNDDVPPVTTTVADIISGGVDQAALEGVVVHVDDLVVTDTTPAGGPGDPTAANEFEVEGGLRVNDFFFVLSPPPTEGQVYPFLEGVARWANNFTKLEPRGPQDVPATLAGFGPALSYLLVGSVDTVPTPAVVVTLSNAADEDTDVALAYENPAILSGPAFVTVPAGTDHIEVALDGVAAGTADVTASYGGNDLSASVRVYDDAEPRLPSLTPASLDLTLGGNGDLTVTIDLPAPPGGLLVNLSASAGATVPASVFIAAGEFAASFTVSAGNSVAVVTVTADTGTGTADATVNVVDSPVFPDLVITEVYYNHTSTDDQYEWVKIYNGTGAAVDMSDYTLAWGGTDYTYGTLALVGTLANGSCFLVGGPQGNAVSGFPGAPAFDQAVDLNPDLQNSGATADAVALFDVPAASITAATVPVHAVIYGGANTSGLLDESGLAGNVDVDNAPAESSIRMNADGTWADNADPTPLACLPLP